MLLIHILLTLGFIAGSYATISALLPVQEPNVMQETNRFKN